MSLIGERIQWVVSMFIVEVAEKDAFRSYSIFDHILISLKESILHHEIAIHFKNN